MDKGCEWICDEQIPMNQPDTYYDYEQDTYTEDEPYDDEVDYKVEKDPVSYNVLSNEYY